ncbi:PREDICTED: probable S-adenosylmethionine-dependent methyltransferase At5g38780 [Tarenaya hassleriana]|uniref:probable S-adenosylmethionine-dependent methyltransferase At5g38780 n=1 Tax=Tarenaya hassleriana TaxID=28532 RepID=UPI00053C9C62|nr:PREDICTED: probable S-adenosylmethionine-dependent methyltransferase At5g38780 [Tarenaya hassleriana]
MEKGDPKPTVTESFPMSGGDGAHSYARNSSLQRGGLFNALNKSREAILANLDLRNPNFDRNNNIVRIADFGCSVGPNTFDAVKHIIDTVKLRFRQEDDVDDDLQDLEFHVFFNDQSNNDFNTLFKTLPKNENCFAAGVPGSFYGRVFPRNSLHIGHTSYTLHWLSRVPGENIGKQNSPAHKEQFEKDIENFLEARSEELVPGGLMIVLGLCISDGVPFAQTGKGIVMEIFLGCLIDIAKAGIISEEKAKTFSFPKYFPHFSEVKEAMERNRRFSVEMMEEIKHAYEDVDVGHELVVSVYRGLYHGVLVEHFGESSVDVLFDRFAEELTKCPLDDIKKTASDREYVIVLRRNLV